MQPLLTQIASVIRHHLDEVVFGITSVTLVLAGPYINGLLKQITCKMNWFLRFILYVFLCCAGYGFLTHFLYQLLIKTFVHFESYLLVIVTLLSYLVLAWFAKRQKQI